MAELPTADQLLGPLPTADSLLDNAGAPNMFEGQPTQTSVMSGPGWDSFIQHSAIGRILNAFGHGAEQAWGTSSLGMTPEIEGALQKWGVLPDVQKGQGGPIRAINEGVIRPAAAALDALYRGANALFAGGQAAVAQAGAEAGQPQLGRDVAAMPEAFFGTPHPEALPSIPEARDLKVIGAGESGWAGTTAHTVEPEATVRAQVKQAQADAANANAPGNVPSGHAPGAFPVATQAPMQPYEITIQPPRDLNDAARQMAPDVFSQYDGLVQQRDALRAEIGQKTQELQVNAEAQAPHAAEIADLQQRLQDTTPRLAKKYQARLAELIPERDAFLADRFTQGALTRDTPEIAALRQQLMQADYRMRDLAPDVTAAYQQAAQRFPDLVPREAEPEPSPAVPQEAPQAAEEPPAPITQAEAETPPAAQEPPAQAASPQAQPEPARPQGASPQPTPAQPVNIAQDVAQKLQAAGRPADEAEAAAALVQAHYEARAARFEGKRGTAEEMYRRDAPEIVAGGEGGRAGQATGKVRLREMELAQGESGSTALRNARNTITLFRKADASTFIHETGHVWLDEMLRDARDPEAPADLLANAASVRKWLNAEEGKPLTVRQHERFARGFERYMMEGVSPSRVLDRVFGRFRGWLTSIYRTVQRLRSPITDDIRDVFDRLLTREPQRATIAPEEFTDYGPAETRRTPYETPGKEPTRLVAFIRKMGGMRDEGGDVRHMLGGAKYRPGLINSTGLPDDEMALRAWEAGYFPELGDQRPSINDLRNAIEDDLKGKPRYSHDDQEAAQAWAAAKERNAEIDRLAEQHGIDTRGMTREQFADAVAKKLSEPEVEQEIEQQETAHEDAFDEYAADAHAEEGGANVPESAMGEPASLEDLDRAHRQAAATRPVQPGASGGEQPATAGRSAGAGEEGGGSRGGGASAPGRVGPQAGPSGLGPAPAERPADPGQSFGPEQPRLIDKAGNIRLDLLNAPDDVNALLREMADQHGDYIVARKGVVTDAEALDMLNAMGATAREMNIRALHRLVMNDPWPMQVRIRAVREAIVQQGMRVRQAMERAAEGAVEDVAAFAREADRLNMIQETLSGITAEWGRAGRAFHQRPEGAAEASALADFLKDSRGRTLYQMRQIAQKGRTLSTPAQLAKFTRDTARPGVFDWVQSYFVNGWLSGPLTHQTYTTAGEIYALFRSVAETGAAAAIGTVRRAFGGEGGIEFEQVAHELYGLFRGATDGASASWAAFKSGQPHLPPEVEAQPDLPGTIPIARPGTIPGKAGLVLESPSRVVTALHTFNWTTFYSQFKAGESFRIARSEGLEGNALAQRIAELRQAPTRQMVADGAEYAQRGALMARPEFGSFMQRVQAVTNWGRYLGEMPLPGGRTLPLGIIRPLKFIDPFVQIAGNIQQVAFGRATPLALFSHEVRSDLMGHNGPAAFDRTAGRLVAGTSFMIAAGWLAARGLLNGSGPTEPAQAAEWRRIHGLPHGLNVGGLSFDTLRLGSLGLQMSVAADLWSAASMIGKEDASQVAGRLAYAFAKNVLDEGFMRGPAEVMQAAEEPGRYGGRFVRSFVASAIPFSVGLSQVARVIDPYSREARTTMDAIRAKLPGISEDLSPRYDVWGQPVANRGWAGTYYGQAQDDPVDKVLYGLAVYPHPVGREVRGVQLSEQQYDDYARTAGRMAYMRLDALIRTPGFTSLPHEAQINAIHGTLTGARETARDLLLMHNPGIIQQAIQAKRALLQPVH